MLILNKETIIRQLIIIYSQCYELYKTEYADSELISNNFQQYLIWYSYKLKICGPRIMIL
jgi:hypothetical protein